MKKTRLILAGGFLGAGKTTLIWDAAKRLMAEGKRVGLVTNDQAPELVDSHLLRNNDMKVAEVAGSCFCCNFNGFVDAIKNLRTDIMADVIIAEPVGSCADLSATIVNPLKKFYSTELTISPLTVLADPSRLSSILYAGNGGLHEDAAYIYRKQLEEADVILITKTDTLTKEQTDKILAETKQAFTSAKVMAISTMTGVGVDEWLKEVGTHIGAGKKLLDIDYDRYAHGEAVLGWLNGTLHLTGKDINWDDVLNSITKQLTYQIASESLRVGHVKLIMECGKDYAVTNLTGADNKTTYRGKAGVANEAKLIVNARVETSPEHLDELVKNVLMHSLPTGCKEEVLAWRYLQPGRPNPTHRFNEVVEITI